MWLRRFSIVGSLLLCSCACNGLTYQDDASFLVSAQADSPEFPVVVNGHLCTDNEGDVGLCSKRISSTESLNLSFDPQNYAYLLTIRCSGGVLIPDATVPANQAYSYTVNHIDMNSTEDFICLGEINPQDRTPPIQAQFEIHVKIYDAKYMKREAMYIQKESDDNYLILGEYARDSWVFDSKWKHYSQATIVKVESDPSNVKAYSGSYVMRYNYFNLKDSDSGVTP